ncbi:MAG: ATP-binding cassette domain-containing protein [Spirochaetales bacterium]|nr:ATP-binding cassette domain-containing protein [Spirochaetales bacterium]
MIKLDNVSYLVAGEPIIADINLSFPEGSTTIIIGPSGCGKSTMLKIAAGLYPNIEGKVLFKGQDVSRMNEKEYQFMQRQTGFLFQDGALWANMSLRDNLTLPVLVTDPKISRDKLEEIVKSTTAIMNFIEPLDQRPAALSAGERKIFSFLRSIVTDPDIFFMDEPTTFIDRNKVGLLKEKILALKEEGKTIIGITHDTDFAMELADYFVLLSGGRVLSYGPVDEVLASRDPVVQVFINDFFQK